MAFTSARSTFTTFMLTTHNFFYLFIYDEIVQEYTEKYKEKF